MGGDRNFAYVVGDEKEKVCAIIDPSYHPEKAEHVALQNNFSIMYVLNTHLHSDHTNGNAYFENKYGLKALHFGAKTNSGEIIEDGSVLPLGKLTIKVIHTPGHTPDSVCYLINDALFTGDTMFVGKIGGTDFGENARLEYDSLHQKLMTLPDHIRVFPGHNYGVSPTSTIGHERRTNPFLIQPDFEHFLDLKMNWAEYKKKHGIK
ncbi:MAG: MBL fold metallo-hydrolase [Calditrichaeota bacterium]|nr:MAG: MBL fold metallo-hydrolase [Calditrichota bacterium]